MTVISPLASRPVIESPCVRVCEYDKTLERCLGCKRTLDEITQWGRMTDQQRQQVIEKLASRD